MSSHNDVVYIKLDVRGAKGFGGKSALYRKLGGVEVQDQIYVMRYVIIHICSISNQLVKKVRYRRQWRQCR